MRQLQKLILHRLFDKIFLCVLAIAYLMYVNASGHFLTTWLSVPSEAVSEQPVNTNPATAVKYWTVASMRGATNADLLSGKASGLTQEGSGTSQGKAIQKKGQLPRNRDLSYPVSTVGKVFATNAIGQDLTCSGTAVVSSNHSVVDTAGHCLYRYGNWVHNVIFCPLYENGTTPYSCWAARALEVPSDWISAQPNDYHHDFGMAIVSPNSQGNLTDLVGGAGWAYNQPANQAFYAYGYPAAYPFDGQTRQSCEASFGIDWQHGSGTVVSIPCNMTGGSSGGPWFIQIRGNWYLNGHNDFTSSRQLGHIFSPYYDDTWYTLYTKAQQT
ncbi:MAG: hypothetical protein M3Z24_14550 [Chloroflexota bacterium]|nr:hypothetical protein [Chloroflexota bacterium]